MTPKVLPEALIEELLAAAGKATPGEWRCETGPQPLFDGHVGALVKDEAGLIVAAMRSGAKVPEQYAHNAAFIALANPQTISSLIAEVKAARASRVLQDEEPSWTLRLAHVEQRTPIEHQASALKLAIEQLGAHPMLTAALNAADLAVRTLGQWHDEGEPGSVLSSLDAEVERILTMSEKQLYAEATGRGEDPAKIAAHMRRIVERAITRIQQQEDAKAEQS